MSAKIRKAFDGWRDENFTCPGCKWSGMSRDMDSSTHRDLQDFSCPKCETMLLIVPWPTTDEVREAAARGDQSAKELLELADSAESFHERADRLMLKSPSDLPAIPREEELMFTWDTECVHGAHGEARYTMIRLGERMIWRECSYYEGWTRFIDVHSILKEKYGKRFKGLRATDRSMFDLLGDDLGAARKLTEAIGPEWDGTA